MRVKQRQYKILHVDDEPLARKAVQCCLQKYHFTVFGARNWQDALEVLHGESIDAVILDLQLPDINGFQILRYLHQSNPFIPVLVLTGDENSLFQCVELGCAGFIEKPYNPTVLQVQLDALLRQRPLVACNKNS